MIKACLALFAAFSLIYALPAQALDYRSLSEAAIMYDAPSPKSKPVYVIARQTPVEVVVALDGWRKVRDASGSLAWLDKRVLSDKRTLLVSVARAQVRNAPDANAPLVFEAEKDVVLELLDPGVGSGGAGGGAGGGTTPGTGWVKVRHRDGSSGHVRVNQVWGL
ncbi:MAG: hypothetical protein KBD60_10690 [Sterolibacterium sp.]|jgi:hypothetical protein|nr:hypothetical protein [Sterolibacterium sp.]